MIDARPANVETPAMAKFPAEAERSTTVGVPLRKAFEFLADVVGSARCIPGLDSCNPVDVDTYCFTFREVAAGGLSMAVRYTARYRTNGKDRIEFESISADGDNTDAQGVIRLERAGKDRTRVMLRQTIAPDTPVPRLLQPLIRSFVEREGGHTMERYLERLKRALESG